MTAQHLDGKTIYEWRAACREIASKFVEFADHSPDCAKQLHRHDIPQRRIDERIVCDSAPCTCGLLSVLATFMPTIDYTLPCPDKQATKSTLRLVAKP